MERFFKNRNSQGEFLDPDIAEGFEKYVDSMSDVLYHTDDIMRTRAFVRYFRRTYAPEEIRNQLEQADALRYAQADQQASFLRDKGKLSYTSARPMRTYTRPWSSMWRISTRPSKT